MTSRALFASQLSDPYETLSASFEPLFSFLKIDLLSFRDVNIFPFLKFKKKEEERKNVTSYLKWMENVSYLFDLGSINELDWYGEVIILIIMKWNYL